jgi:hypothetical protein
MSCHLCHDLCVTYRIRTPKELSNAASIAQANVQDGTLKEVATGKPIFEPVVSFETFATGSAWPDIVSYCFECTNCGERFALEAETYHGSGGTWAPIRPEASRENL